MKHNMQCTDSAFPESRQFYDQGKIRNSIVYLVDDDYDDRIYAYSLLRRSSRVTEVRPVKCAESLFKCLDNVGIYDSSVLVYNPSIILLDIHMPGLNGIETLSQIRNHPVTSDIPVILMTSDTSCEKVYDAYRLRANGFLEKPLDLERFHNVMDSGWNWVLDAGNDRRH
jgi:CheY-like chemotaxis protein